MRPSENGWAELSDGLMVLNLLIHFKLVKIRILIFFNDS
ncbi:hypothetical protein TW90_1815 [Neisseria flavescens]|nr:hypothetical protein NEIFL0001_0906 [Neisseria flavescens SK114]KZC85378.1 hypothetical protein TW90_1815 [Neisseria flavescens]